MIKYIILGIVQGLTEFIPVSSSGHLVVIQRLFKMQGELILLDVVLHFATTLALIAFFFKDIFNLLTGISQATWQILRERRFRSVWSHSTDLRLGIYILVSTLITGIVGYLGKGFFERLFSSARPVSFFIFITGIILVLTKKFAGGKRDILKIRIGDSIFLGIAQSISIIPGISRSGITISGLLFRDVNRDTAFRFSFLAAVPAILGALILKLKEATLSNISIPHYLVGFIASFITGIIALKLLNNLVHRAKFFYFGYYCMVLALVLFILTLFKILA